MTADNAVEYESRQRLAEKTLERLRKSGVITDAAGSASRRRVAVEAAHRRVFDFTTLPEYQPFRYARAASDLSGVGSPYFRLHAGRAADISEIDGSIVVNFSSYDYLGLNGEPFIVEAAKAAIDRYGTSVSASRLVAGERPIHRELEAALARVHGVDAALSFVSGHATNVTTVGCLMGLKDLVLADALIHNSVAEGIRLSGAARLSFPHGDLDAAETLLRTHRSRHRRVLIVVEGLYSMDGDVPDLARLVALKQHYDAWLMVDEAHAFGVLGASGRGIAEEQGVDPREVEIWMGTLSKSLAGAGGYIAGSDALIDYLKFAAPGHLYSVGLAPSLAATATAAIGMLEREPERVRRLRTNGQLFVERAKAAGLDVGASIGASVVPVIVGDSLIAVFLSNALLLRGFNVIPIVFPAVAERQARLRFFITSRHTTDQIEAVVAATAEELGRLRSNPDLMHKLLEGINREQLLKPVEEEALPQ